MHLPLLSRHKAQRGGRLGRHPSAALSVRVKSGDVQFPPTPFLQAMPTLQDELCASVSAFETHTLALFGEWERASALDQSAQSESDGGHLTALQELDSELPALLAKAARHQANQARLVPLLARVQAREMQQRETIARVAALRNELRALLDAADAEAADAAAAEQGRSRAQGLSLTCSAHIGTGYS